MGILEAVARDSSPGARRLSATLRQGTGEHLRRRRTVAGLSLTAMASLGVVTLYQMGLLRHLPEPPLPGLDSDTVDASGEAYAMFSMPDGPLGLLSYAATLCLAAMGGADRARTRPWLPLAMAAKVGVDALGAAQLTVEQATKHRRFCSYCLTAAVATAAAVPQVLPEAGAAWRQVRGR